MPGLHLGSRTSNEQTNQTVGVNILASWEKICESARTSEDTVTNVRNYLACCRNKWSISGLDDFSNQ